MKEFKKRLIGLVIVLFIFLSTQKCTAQTVIPNNLTIFSNLIQQSAFQVLEQVKADSTCTIVLLTPKNKHNADWLVEKEFIRVLSQKGISNMFVKTKENVLDFSNYKCGLTIVYQPIVITTTYNPKRDNNSKDKDLIERILIVELYVHVKDEHEKIQFAKTIRKEYSDTISKTQRITIESVHYPFTCGERLRSSFFTQFIEPFVGIAAAGAVLYMFYSFRSK